MTYHIWYVGKSSGIVLEVIQNDKSFCINLIDLGTFQLLFRIIFTLYGMITPCDVTFIIFGYLDWFPWINPIDSSKPNIFNLCSAEHNFLLTLIS